ncbi:MAG: caspase family protein, partial [Deltaproteobacteria bacterium]|nr:caspase family protein [Deltaproteobacteria bacterium]
MIRLVPLLILLPLLAGAGLVPVQVDQGAIDGSMAPRKLALIVGVSEYDDSMFTPLGYAKADAEAMRDVLGNEEFGAYDEVRTLVRPSETTSTAITDALERLLATAGPEDTVLVYVSGHGTLDLDWQQQPELFLVGSDTERDDLPRTALRVKEIQDLVGASEARRKVLIIDACHHGAGKSKVAPETIARLRGIKGSGGPVLRDPERGFEAHLFASTFGLPALEDPVLGHGVYTHYLIEAMSEAREEADRDGDNLVSVSEAHDWARDHTISHTAAVQVPRAEYKIVGREQIFLSGDESERVAAQQAMIFTFDDYYLRCSVTVDGEDMGLLPRGIALSPGEHDVQIATPSGELLASRKVRVQAGDVVDVASLHAGVKVERFRLGVGGGVFGAFGDQAGDPLGG